MAPELQIPRGEADHDGDTKSGVPGTEGGRERELHPDRGERQVLPPAQRVAEAVAALSPLRSAPGGRCGRQGPAPRR